MAMLEVLLGPERRAAALEYQEKLREKFGDRVVIDPAERKFLWGQQLERLALDQLESDDFSDRGKHVLDQLSEGCAAQARFDEAADLAQDSLRKKYYQACAAAVERFGTSLCQCPPTKIYPDGRNAKGRSIPSAREIERVFDGERQITLTRCLHCETISAR